LDQCKYELLLYLNLGVWQKKQPYLNIQYPENSNCPEQSKMKIYKKRETRKKDEFGKITVSMPKY